MPDWTIVTNDDAPVNGRGICFMGGLGGLALACLPVAAGVGLLLVYKGHKSNKRTKGHMAGGLP
jgi:hypothetical protein